MRLHLVRHPAPDVPSGYCYGRTDLQPDPADTARVLAHLRHAGLDTLPVISSPLARCATLARALAPAPAFDARLAEMDFGAWELRSWDEIPRVEVDAWNADLLDYHPGGGESVMEVATRVAAFHADILRAAPDAALVICHAGTIRLLAALHEGGPVRAAAHRAAATPHRIAYGEVMLLNR